MRIIFVCLVFIVAIFALTNLFSSSLHSESFIGAFWGVLFASIFSILLGYITERLKRRIAEDTYTLQMQGVMDKYVLFLEKLKSDNYPSQEDGDYLEWEIPSLSLIDGHLYDKLYQQISKQALLDALLKVKMGVDEIYRLNDMMNKIASINQGRSEKERIKYRAYQNRLKDEMEKLPKDIQSVKRQLTSNVSFSRKCYLMSVQLIDGVKKRIKIAIN